ncbi:hypothetical protein BU17DRAFT_38749 [Hysterangium stoloniferum]|nr:hypothetical protein BU17DRAFT_38749 [Hysterangium stoloniferum]
MDVYAGGVVQSDVWFASFTKTIDDILKDEDAPVKSKHRVLQLVLIFMCGVKQLSPGAYFLRRNLYPSLVSLILSPQTQPFTFETTLSLCLLSNFHKSDAAKTNPYLNQVKQADDEVLIARIGWIVAYAAQKAVSAYQSILDDSAPSLATSFTSFVTALRPDRALSATPVDPPKDLFKQQPIEAAVVLLPLHDFLHYNSTFRKVFQSPFSESSPQAIISLPDSLISLSSYILTHASSASSPRSLGYAYLSLSTLLVVVEDADIVHALCQPRPADQNDRPPYLPYIASARPPVCAVLDCCVLWLRHNLHKRLEVLSYLMCIRIVNRILRHLSVEKLRIEYLWEELWRSLILVLEFSANQIGSLKSIAKVDELVQEVIFLLDYVVRSSERFLPSPQSLHQLVYELVRARTTFTKQHELLNNLKHQTNKRNSLTPRGSAQLSALEELATYYQTKLTESNIQSANAVMKLLGQLVDQEGIHGVFEQSPEELPM